jgi:drug/metabolite transporter (DMT)-like permease
MSSFRDLAVVTPLALGAAISFAVANVLQMRAARRLDGPKQFSLRLLATLLSDRGWLLGLAASVVGYALQAIALFLAPVVLVQPLIVTELLFALPLAAALAGTALHGREWAGAGLVAGGIVCFLLVSRPSGERTSLSTTGWLTVSGAIAAAVVALVLFAGSRRSRPVLRAGLLAAAASACFGFLSVLTKVVGHQFSDERLAALTRAQPWLLAIVAITGLLLTQTAFRIAPLSVSMPVIDIGEPLVASLLAVLAFGEKLGSGLGMTLGVVIAATAAIAGVMILNTSPLARTTQLQLDQLPAPRPVGAAGHTSTCDGV